MIGRLPALPAPITNAWAATSGHLLVTTPPEPVWNLFDLTPDGRPADWDEQLR